MTKTYIIVFDDLDLLMDHGVKFNAHWDKLNEKTLRLPVEMDERDYNDYQNFWETDEEE